jgi:hypothetical protein
MEARFLALGAKLAVLAPDEFEGTPLVVQIGITRFRQRLFSDGCEILDEIFA